MPTVAYKKKALKVLLRMPRPLAEKFRLAFSKIANDEASGLDVRALKGAEAYRLRIGAYRAIYEIHEGELRVLVLSIGPRGDVYK